MAKVLTINDFNDKVKKEGVAIVDFFATWCGPCKMLAPIFEELGNELGDQAGFYKVDIDESLELANEYGIQSVPTMLVFKIYISRRQSFERNLMRLPFLWLFL